MNSTQLSYLGVGPALLSAFEERKKEPYNRAPKQNIGSQIFSLLVGIFAVYLSWNCNTVEGVSVPLKVLYAFFAFLFGPLYLIFYAIMRGFKICA